jgi:murein DD-endopeptidase MepM/ murein hydrolase activator NlpD
MQNKHQISLTRKFLYGIMLLGIFLNTFGSGNLLSAHAQKSIKSAATDILYQWSPNANIVLYWSPNSDKGGPGIGSYDLNLYNAETNQFTVLAKNGGSGPAKFSKDGSTISFWNNNNPYITNLDDDVISVGRVDTTETIIKGAFSSNNDMLIYTTESGEIRMRNLISGLETILDTFENISTLPNLLPEWSPNDQWVAFGTESNGILINPSGTQDPIILPDLALPQSEISNVFHYFIWSDSSNTIYDYSGKPIYTFTANIDPTPIIKPNNSSFDDTFEILSLDDELFLHNIDSDIKIQLTSNKSLIKQLLEQDTQSLPEFQVIPKAATANGFDFPVGKPNGDGYNTTAGCWWLQTTGACAPGPHPGQDFNGNGGGDSDLGDPVYAVANGDVVFSGTGSGTSWGNIILIEHTLPDGTKVWSQYAHLKDRYANSGSVNKGDLIGTIGKGYNNIYYAHLHFEIRIQYRAADAWISGWSTAQVEQYYVNPSDYINNHRTISGGTSCPTVSGEVRLYDLTNCGGGYAILNSTGLWSLAANFNDRAESIAIPSGWSVRLYQNDNENSNESACFGSTDTNLNDNTFANGGVVGNQATWARVYDNSNCTGVSVPSAPALNSPGNGQYFNEGDSINLSWSATGSEYYGEVWGGPGGTLTFGWQSGTSINIGSQWAGYTYSWHVKARNGSGESGWSETRMFTVRPGAPSNLSATAASCSQINLGWSDNSGNEEGYKVYRNSSLIATLGSGATSYQSTGLAGNTNYSFTVTAYRGSIESNSSNSANATTQTCSTPPGTPTGVSATDGSYTDRVRVSWTAQSGATSYQVYRNSSNSSSGASLIGSPSSSPFDDASATVNITYWYFVKACNAAGCSAFSASDSGYRAVGSATDDNYEENDTLATAYDLSSYEQTWLSAINGYGIQADYDWYRIYVTPGFEDVKIDLRFTHSQGDIDVALYDSAGNFLAVSQSTSDNEYIDYTVPVGGTYYFIKVYYANGGNQYNLWWADIQPLSSIFADVPSTYWAYSYIERLYNAGITGGCGTNPLIYCPDATVTRAQMAVFLLVAKHGSAYTPPPALGTVFGDVPTSHWAAKWIEALAAEGITGGCGSGNYCPDAVVTRAQMAVFLLVAKHGSAYTPPPATGIFGDVPTTHWAAKWIEALAAEGITGGCGSGNYCPEAVVTRAQMAVFLVTAFSLP